MKDRQIVITGQLVYRNSYIAGITASKAIVEEMRRINIHNEHIETSCNIIIAHLNDIIMKLD